MNADELLSKYILQEFRDEYGGGCWGVDDSRPYHLAHCEQAHAGDCDASDGTYGCETGCDWVTLTAAISCPHGEPYEYEYGSFGTIDSIIWEMERMA
jgi:hypothetical protein